MACKYLWAAAFSRCGNVFFPLRQLFGLQSWGFSAAGFFLPRPVFFLPRTVFSRCLQNAFFLLQRCFCAAARCFSAALNFSRCEAAFFAGVFPAAEIAFSRCRAFFSCCQTCFFRSDVFFLLRTCVFRALREDKELENVESYTGRSPLVSWIAHRQKGDKGDQSLKQPSANESLNMQLWTQRHVSTVVDTSENGKKNKKKQKNDNNHKNNNNNKNNHHHHRHLHHYNLHHHQH